MSPRVVLFPLRAILLVGVVMPTACGGAGGDVDLKPPPGFVPPPVRPLQRVPVHGRLGFGRGFWPLELGADGKTWRWMAGRGEIRLRNDHRQRQRRLRILGWVPLEFLKGAPTIRITLESHLLDTFVASARTLNRGYLIKPELFGDASSALLVIETSATVRAPGDTRDLGVSIEGVQWGSNGRQVCSRETYASDARLHRWLGFPSKSAPRSRPSIVTRSFSICTTIC